MKKMVRNDDAFTQRFRTAKGVRTLFFFRFGAIAAYGPKTRKKRVRIHFMKTWYGRFTRKKYLVRTNFSVGLDPFFFRSVNGALACRRLLFLSLHRIFLSVSNSKILIFLENAGFLCERKENLKKYRCYKIYSYRQTQASK